MAEIATEESNYKEIPKLYDFGTQREKEVMLLKNFKRVNNDIEKLVSEIYSANPQSNQE